MNRKKMMPLIILAAGVVLLALLLAVLTLSQSESQEQGIALCSFPADDVDGISYSGNNTEISLLKGSEGDWLLESDPTLPLDQSIVGTLVEKLAGLTATRQLQEDELAEIPAWSDTPLMVFTITSGDVTRTLTVERANDVADIYYVYDENSVAYTVTQSDVNVLCKTPKDLYKAQTLTDKTIDDVASMQVESLAFVQNDGVWTLADDAEYPLDQDAVKKMANTICGAQTDWTITSPETDSTYGLDAPDVTATLTFTDGSNLTVRFGSLVADDETLCYVASSGAQTVIYEVSADYKSAFAVTKETLYDETATAESAEEEEDTIVAEHPVGGKDDYADVAEQE